LHEKREASYGAHSTSKHPGKAGGHSDAAEDRAMIKTMVKPSALSRADGGKIAADGREDPKRMMSANDLMRPKLMGGSGLNDRKSGGKVKKGKSKTHINIIVGQPAQDREKPVPVPIPVPGGGAGGMPPAAMGPKPPMPMPQGGPMAGLGGIGGTAGLPRKGGGPVDGPGSPVPGAPSKAPGIPHKKGGAVHLTGGAGGGRGRLQKNHMR
jgi:hypothetical protein